MKFANRTIAGIQLAQELSEYKNRAIVFAIPRGGVPVAKEIATGLNVPLDLIITRKIGHPHQPEFAVCAVTEHHHVLCDERIRPYLDIVWLNQAINQEYQEAKRRRLVYNLENIINPQTIAGKTLIAVDDGIATGLTMKAAIDELSSYQPDQLVVAAPVISQDAYQELLPNADKVISLYIPEYFGAVGMHYHYFPQLTDTDVNKSLTPH